MKKTIAAALALTMAFSITACGSSQSTSTATSEAATEAATTEAATTEAAGASYKVTLITMDQMDAYWNDVAAGADQAIGELKDQGTTIDYSWIAPEQKDNQQQIEEIEIAVADNTQAIVIAVNDTTACNSALQEAIDAGIKIVYVDAAASLDAEATFKTDNYQAGYDAGSIMVQNLKDAGIAEGQIGIVSAQQGVQSCMDRCDGFTKAVEEDGTYTVSEVQYCDADIAKGQSQAETLIANGVIGLFGAQTDCSIACGNACKAAANKVYCVGFDFSDTVGALMKEDAIQACMNQNPYEMGYEGILAAVKALNGEDLGGAITDTGCNVVTIENIADFE